ncbi:MAG: multidrug ABC transporter ATP-binding protein [Elusimicrobia bacterium CG_4_9_14_3_um_filter_62_55]|nr:MAG: multidrug ABC transporter ATP-binding protein [Elusimicrobia bacterium CG22_combo_CG10-13_8_21_14_all_63_91]PJA16386.1 MAG: multidrug ABC transporter ATP-binding protein [Elusimicrobia bacterium CG_4_10_14_0_2_um_filter_63_34]PJB27110.1 MAG: multidrug ABC transporter ATP-binding protein [Elusimicrobia bacterium CG_4_9_14_3_um_filter_62_55]
MTEKKDWELEEELARGRLSTGLLKRSGRFLAPYRRQIVVGLLMEVGWCFSYMAGPHLVRIAVDEYLVPGAFGGLALICALYAANTVARAFWVGREIRMLVGAGQRILGDLRRAVFEHLQTLSMSYFDRTQQGRIIARVDRDIDALEHPLIWGPVSAVSTVFLLTLSIGSMLYFDRRLTAVVVLCLPSLVLSSEVFRRIGLRAYREARSTLSRVTAQYAESINGMKVIQACVQEPRSLREGDGKIAAVRRAAEWTIRVWSAYIPVISLHYGISGAALLFFGGRGVLAGQLTLGELVAFLMMLEFVFEPIEEMGQLYNEVLGASAAAERVFQVLDTKPQIVDHARARALTSVQGWIGFDNVRFRYRGDLPWVLHGLSFTLEPGTTTAIVGHTGAGKSSLAGLLCRFYDAQEGVVSVDGRDIREIEMESLRRSVAMIPQDGYLFSGTVLENLRFGRPDASDEEIVAAARELGAEEILRALPDAFATEVGERGSRLSHGQRQAVCYVRALLADPRILIFDEATSSLDALTEKTLQRAFGRLSGGRTTVVIAHRLSTIRDAGRILVVDAGRIVESGTHAELLAGGGHYARLYSDYALVGALPD